MALSRHQFEGLVLKEFSKNPRFTQDSPIYPEVWLDYFENKDKIGTYRVDLILIPHNTSTAAELFSTLQKMLDSYKRRAYAKKPALARNKKDVEGGGRMMASNGETVAARLTLEELINVALPLTSWFQKYLWKDGDATPDQIWLKQVIAAIYTNLVMGEKEMADPEKFLRKLELVFKEHYTIKKLVPHEKPLVLWSVSKNRQAKIALEKSVPTTKADATRRLFNIDASNITWAILDTGVDASHVGFLKTDPATGKKFKNPFGQKNDPDSNQTRIVATYDFSRFRSTLADINTMSNKTNKTALIQFLKNRSGSSTNTGLDEMEIESFIVEIQRDLGSGRMLDWSIVAPLFRIPHNISEYRPPTHPHGTHVAGILAADMTGQPQNSNYVGMCPGINIYDIRVLDDSGQGNEFNILAGIQFIKWLNNQKKDGLAIHGINISISIPHAVKSYACGQTPVCVACEQIVNDGVVVVAAAGNQGQSLFTDVAGSLVQGFRMVNITDPGNTESVITVGATHAEKPHTYGVSYFSSKGPTGDGRSKPDIVAPGEKVKSTIPGNRIDRMDGTSQAAPHVSGAAALIMAKNPELTGRPRKIKQILCDSATDLGREKYFQGCGMVDTLRALQSI